ncbi:MAG: hypothetical protein MHPSP_002462, partial [Paramarteilia canceri]
MLSQSKIYPNNEILLPKNYTKDVFIIKDLNMSQALIQPIIKDGIEYDKDNDECCIVPVKFLQPYDPSSKAIINNSMNKEALLFSNTLKYDEESVISWKLTNN